MGEHEHEWDVEYRCTVCDINAIGAYEATRAERDALAAQVVVLKEALGPCVERPFRDPRCTDVEVLMSEADYSRALAALADPSPRAADLLAVVEAARAVRDARADDFGSADNSPGHAHVNPPRWDADGTICKRCEAWMTLMAALARFDGKGE